MILWHCPRCGHDKPPAAFYCLTPPHEAGAAWWCRACVRVYVNGTHERKTAA